MLLILRLLTVFVFLFSINVSANSDDKYDNFSFNKDQSTGNHSVNYIERIKVYASTSKKPIVLYLDNGGGNLIQTLPLAKKIYELAEVVHNKHNWPLFVYVTEICASACVPTFFELLKFSKKNQKKIFVKVSKYAHFGFHGAFYSPFPDVISDLGTSMYLDSLHENGVRLEWLTRKVHLFTSTRMTYRRADTLVSENIGLLEEKDLF